MKPPAWAERFTLKAQLERELEVLDRAERLESAMAKWCAEHPGATTVPIPRAR